VPADWRRSAWGLFLVLLGLSFVLATAGVAVTVEAAQLVGGGLLIGLGMGLTDHIVGREHERLSDRLRNLVSRT
jgi:uncharacterized membrane protein